VIPTIAGDPSASVAPLTEPFCTPVPGKLAATPVYGARICASAGDASVGSCSPGTHCVPDPDPSTAFYRAGFCVAVDGEYDCSGLAHYPQKHVVAQAIDDTRSCSVTGCSCARPDAGTCAYDLRFYSDTGCGNQALPSAGPGCYDVTGGIYSFREADAAPLSDPCVPSGTATVSGTITTTGTVTLCCTN